MHAAANDYSIIHSRGYFKKLFFTYFSGSGIFIQLFEFSYSPYLKVKGKQDKMWIL